MFLTEKQHKQKEWLNSLGIYEVFPYIENGIVSETDNIEEIYFKAVYSYTTFKPIVEKNHHYSANELRNIKLIQRYQKAMNAHHSNIQRSNTTLTEQQIQGYDHITVRHIINKANRVNQGIYFITGLKSYTSSTLVDNPTVEQDIKTKRCRKTRVFGRIEIVLPKTLELLHSSTTFDYPYSIDGKESSSDNIYDVYEQAYKFGNLFEVLDARDKYSSQEKRIIRKLKRLGDKVE